MGVNSTKNKRIYPDILLLLLTILLTAIGLLVIYSAANVSETMRKITVQSIAALIGIAFLAAFYFIDYRIYKVYSSHIYILSIVVLIFVLIFGSGKEETGANSWIRFFGIGVQPSELVKIAFSVFFANKLSGIKESGRLNDLKELLKLTAYFLGITVLVIMQNDTGTALVFTFMFATMLFVAGIPIKYILWAFLILAIALPVFWFLLATYQKNRILVFLNPSLDPNGAGYQVLQSRIAIGSGELFGRGFMQGPRNRLSLIPEKDTDFIFGVIGEEFGFLGSVIVCTLLFLLIFKIFTIAKHATDLSARLICVGIGSMFLFHVSENICMSLGLLPVTGIPLPFLSYGGSSLVTSLLAIGIVLNINKISKEICFNKSD
ncbi:MAG: rod shape-determining protein RodA [Clostridia bacterium]|nr:rod shape-determining protein RodA [Clostridia bacterium]